MYRFYETIPGILAWGTIALLFILSWIIPETMAIFIILFDIYWLLKTIYLSFHLRASFREMRKNLKIDWQSKLVQDANRKGQSIDDKRLAISDWQSLYHVIILTMYN
ncbi:MAG: hypothetical protein AAB967_01820, partial [Patescibacteria group bacterium]